MISFLRNLFHPTPSTSRLVQTRLEVEGLEMRTALSALVGHALPHPPRHLVATRALVQRPASRPHVRGIHGHHHAAAVVPTVTSIGGGVSGGGGGGDAAGGGDSTPNVWDGSLPPPPDFTTPAVPDVAATPPPDTSTACSADTTTSTDTTDSGDTGSDLSGCATDSDY